MAALGWLGWRLLEQERALESRRERDRLESAASLLANELERGLKAWEDRPPPAAVSLIFDSSGILQQQGIRLPFFPRVPPPAEIAPGVFAAAEVQEFRERGLTKAAAAYRNLASTRDQPLRAAALMRLARCLRQQKETREALAVYSELAAMEGTPVAGSPAELMARRERIALFRTLANRQGEAAEIAALGSALRAPGGAISDRSRDIRIL